MENVHFENPVDRTKPVHFWAGETEQFRLKVQRYSSTPPEFTVQRISFDGVLAQYRKAAEFSRSVESSVPAPRRARVDPGADRSEESIENSQRRAKTNVRKLVTELAPNHFSTFTTREAGPVYFTSADWRDIWAHFVALVRSAGLDFGYVAVLERHPKNPQHLHLHVAWRGVANYNFLRRLWHIAIARHKGQRLTKMARGDDAPGNIQDEPVKAPRGSFKQVRKIARYISKYITKDLICEFNKKRYWPSKGIDLASAQVFWLDSLTQAEAIREACLMLGQWDDEFGLTPQHLFSPSERVCWCAIDPDKSPPPPF
jgi:hypothetical protein